MTYDQKMYYLGWVRKEQYDSTQCRANALQTDLWVTQDALRESRNLVRKLSSDFICPIVNAQRSVKGTTVGTWEEHHTMYTVHYLCIPEVRLRCNDTDYMRVPNEQVLREVIMDAWAYEFRKILPDILRGIK